MELLVVSHCVKTNKKRIRDRSQLTIEQSTLLKENIDKLHIDDLADILGVTRRSLFLILRGKYNLEDHWNLYDINPSLFLKPLSPEVAYILGFIWGDGAVRRDTHGIIIDIVGVDAKSIYNILFSVGKWKYREAQRLGKQPSSSFTTYNAVMAKFLGENDYYEKSSKSPCKILNLIPEENRHLFFRGWFDADGCISADRGKYFSVAISGTLNQDWSALKNLSLRLNCEFGVYKVTDKHSSSSFSFLVSGQKRFLDYIYQNREVDQIGFPRKFEKYEMLSESKKTLSGSETGVLGVYLTKNKKRYFAKICWLSDGKIVNNNLGYFPDLDSAAIAYDQAIVRRKGYRAKTNFPIENYLNLISDPLE